MNKKERLSTDLYCITAEKFSLGRSNIEVVKEMIDAGIKIIQYREKKKKMLYKYQECKRLREMTKEAGVSFIINDDIHLAMAIGADGVHIGQEDLPLEEVRRLLGKDKIIGLSTHSPQEAEDAVKRGADYIGVGPIFKTNTKDDVCDPVGLEYLEYVVENLDIPFVAIGGIKEHNVDQVWKLGGRCICMVTEIVGAEDIKAKIRSIRQKLN
ncbi:thiamine phosphate synthase [Orenia marismortui]|uniref:thiamine phosphate synthase n=1 Tax=Orenia marismortui TaxID=46469 RepID=UPI000370BD4F|nr:thiamine phosphate synthase [Orenia marismortui]